MDTSVDVGAVLEHVALQRNAALDELAKWKAKAGELAAEIDRLTADLGARDQ